MRKFMGIVGQILERVPFAIGMAERFLGGNNGVAKKTAAAREIMEFVLELIKDDPTDEWSDVGALEIEGLVAAMANEAEFVAKISDVNDAVVALVNYINEKAPAEQ